jgi:uncharacterized membrane protein
MMRNSPDMLIISFLPTEELVNHIKLRLMNYFLLIFISHFVQYSAKIKSEKQKRKQKNCFLQNMLIYQQSHDFPLFLDK